jgi:hypothetical protein
LILESSLTLTDRTEDNSYQLPQDGVFFCLRHMALPDITQIAVKMSFMFQGGMFVAAEKYCLCVQDAAEERGTGETASAEDKFAVAAQVILAISSDAGSSFVSTVRISYVQASNLTCYCICYARVCVRRRTAAGGSKAYGRACWTTWAALAAG